MKILKFGAVWCTECLVMRPMWAEIEKMFPKLVTETYDADQDIDILKKYDIGDIPSFIFIDGEGEVVTKLKGVQDKEALIIEVEKFLNK